jgi:putative transposase
VRLFYGSSPACCNSQLPARDCAGDNREAIFYDDANYQFYLDKLKLASDKYGCDLHAYVSMTKHIHLLITPKKEKGLAKALQMIGRYYFQ